MIIKTQKPDLSSLKGEDKIDALSFYISSLTDEISFNLNSLSQKIESIKNVINKGE